MIDMDDIFHLNLSANLQATKCDCNVIFLTCLIHLDDRLIFPTWPVSVLSLLVPLNLTP